MAGEKDLSILLRSLAPVLGEEVYTFATMSEPDFQKLREPRGVFRETEGISVICLVGEARALGLRHDGEFRKITLSVHSSLAAVGLMARISTALAEAGIACNVVAGFYHDHFFVPADRAVEAQTILSNIKPA